MDNISYPMSHRARIRPNWSECKFGLIRAHSGWRFRMQYKFTSNDSEHTPPATRVATETAQSNSRTFQDFLRSFSRTFPGLFKIFFTRLKNLILAITLSCTYFFVLVIDQNFDVTHLHSQY